MFRPVATILDKCVKIGVYLAYDDGVPTVFEVKGGVARFCSRR